VLLAGNSAPRRLSRSLHRGGRCAESAWRLSYQWDDVYSVIGTELIDVIVAVTNMRYTVNMNEDHDSATGVTRANNIPTLYSFGIGVCCLVFAASPVLEGWHHADKFRHLSEVYGSPYAMVQPYAPTPHPPHPEFPIEPSPSFNVEGTAVASTASYSGSSTQFSSFLSFNPNGN
jgi:hypothetical protein